MQAETVSYSGRAEACALIVVVASVIAFVVVYPFYETAQGNAGWLVLIPLGYPFVLPSIRFAGSICFSATLEADRMTFRQLTRTTESRVGDVQRIAKGSHGEGNTPDYTIHFTDGRGWLSGKGGTVFVDALLRAAPAIHVERRGGWLTWLRRRLGTKG